MLQASATRGYNCRAYVLSSCAIAPAVFGNAPRAHFFRASSTALAAGVAAEAAGGHWPPRRRLHLAEDLEESLAIVKKDVLAAVAGRGQMIARAGIFDAQRTCHDAKMAGWNYVGILDLTPCALCWIVRLDPMCVMREPHCADIHVGRCVAAWPANC